MQQFFISDVASIGLDDCLNTWPDRPKGAAEELLALLHPGINDVSLEGGLNVVVGYCTGN